MQFLRNTALTEILQHGLASIRTDRTLALISIHRFVCLVVPAIDVHSSLYLRLSVSWNISHPTARSPLLVYFDVSRWCILHRSSIYWLHSSSDHPRLYRSSSSRFLHSRILIYFKDYIAFVGNLYIEIYLPSHWSTSSEMTSYQIFYSFAPVVVSPHIFYSCVSESLEQSPTVPNIPKPRRKYFVSSTPYLRLALRKRIASSLLFIRSQSTSRLPGPTQSSSQNPI